MFYWCSLGPTQKHAKPAKTCQGQVHAKGLFSQKQLKVQKQMVHNLTTPKKHREDVKNLLSKRAFKNFFAFFAFNTLEFDHTAFIQVHPRPDENMFLAQNPKNCWLQLVAAGEVRRSPTGWLRSPISIQLLGKLVFVTSQRFLVRRWKHLHTCFAQVCFDMVKAHFETIRMFSKLFLSVGWSVVVTEPPREPCGFLECLEVIQACLLSPELQQDA